MILAHTDPAMVGRLLNRLRGSAVHLHVDLGVDIDDFDRLSGASRIPGVSYVRSRHHVNWGGYSVVRAMVDGMRQALPDLETSEHVVFLSGACYPLRDVSSFHAYLNDAPWRVHARAYSLADLGGFHTDRYERRHGFDGPANMLGPHGSVRRRAGRRLWRAVSNLRPRAGTELRVVAGSQWMALPRLCAEEALDTVSGGDYEFFRDSFAPDEMVLQTFIYNSSWRALTEFGGTEPTLGHGVAELPNFHVLDSKLRGVIDPQRVLNPRGREFFARKFSSSADASLLDQLERGTNTREPRG